MNDCIRLPRSALTDEIWRSENLARLILYLMARADENGEIALSTSFMAKELGLGRQSIRTALRRLEIEGFVSIDSTKTTTIVKIVGCNENSPSKPSIFNKAMVFNTPKYEDIYEWVRQSGKILMNQGFVYAIEFGQFVKIGCSALPYNRFLALRSEYRRSMGLSSGRMIITPPCSNYKALECNAHAKFASKRIKGREIFEVEFEDVVDFFTTLVHRISNV